MFCRTVLTGLCLALMLGVAPASAQSLSYQGLWWGSPSASESGWGINFTHQGDVVFATWFTYAPGGRPLWLVATLQQQAGTARFSGDIYTTLGPALTSVPFDPAMVTKAKVGVAEVDVPRPGNGDLHLHGVRCHADQDRDAADVPDIALVPAGLRRPSWQPQTTTKGCGGRPPPDRSRAGGSTSRIKAT